VTPNETDAGLTYRKAIYTPMSDTLPAPWVIDIETCLNTPPNYIPCQRCVEVCDDNAIFFNLPLETIHQRHVGAVILAPGFRTEDPGRFGGLGYGTHADIVTSAELQRLLEAPGPTGGYASRPSDEEYPESVLLVLDNPSKFALYIVASQVHQLIEQDIERVSVLLLAQPADDTQREAAQALAEQAGVEVHWGGMFKVDPDEENHFEISYEDMTEKRLVRESYDLVVLCSDVEPPLGLEVLAEAAGVELADDGYIRVNGDNGVETTREGVYVAGCASGAKNIKDSMTGAQAAAGSATSQLDPRQLGAEAPAPTGTDSRPPLPPDTRQQIEQLLYALIDR
jgi:heterodisulfide reductase subunit A